MPHDINKDGITLIGTSTDARRKPTRVLLKGQYAYETDTGLLRLGDGSTPYNRLTPFPFSQISLAMINQWNSLITTVGILSTLVTRKQIDQKPTSGSFGSISGDIDGSNKIFYCSKGKYIPETLLVYKTALLEEGKDYVKTSGTTGRVDMVTAPISVPGFSETLTFVYEYPH